MAANVEANIFLGFDSGGAEVWGHDDFRVRDERCSGGGSEGRLGCKDVDAGTGDVIIVEGRDEGLLVDHATAGNIEDPSAFFHALEFIGANHAFCARDQGGVDA